MASNSHGTKQTELLQNNHFWLACFSWCNKENNMYQQMGCGVLAIGKRKTQTQRARSVWWPLSHFLLFLFAAVCDSGKTALHAISAKPAFLSIFKSLSADAIIWKTKQNKKHKPTHSSSSTYHSRLTLKSGKSNFSFFLFLQVQW